MKARSAPARRGILAAGNFIIDRISVVDHYPREDTFADILRVARANGGPAFNALVDWARLQTGIPLEACGVIGTDADGDFVLRQLREHGVDTRQLHRHPRALTSWSDIITVAGSGRRTFFHHRGANAHLDVRHVDLEATRARVFFLAFLALLDRLDRPDRRHGTRAARLLAAARARGLITAADVVSAPGPRLRTLAAAALPHIDHFFCNELEASSLTGVNTRRRSGRLDARALRTAAARMGALGAAGWVVIHAAEGALALHRDGREAWQGSVRVPAHALVGTNGAGDAFAAGYLVGVHEGEDIDRCLRLGAAVAAASLRDSTPSHGVLPLSRCLALATRLGHRRFAA